MTSLLDQKHFVEFKPTVILCVITFKANKISSFKYVIIKLYPKDLKVRLIIKVRNTSVITIPNPPFLVSRKEEAAIPGADDPAKVDVCHQK